LKPFGVRVSDAMTQSLQRRPGQHRLALNPNHRLGVTGTTELRIRGAQLIRVSQGNTH